MEFNDREKKALKISIWLGAAFGVVMVILYFFSMFSEPFDGVSSAVAIVVIAATSLMQVATAVAGTAAFTYLFIKWRVKKWLSFPVGTGLGAVAAGLSGGLTLGILFAIAVPTGAISMGTNWVWIDTVLEGFWLGFKGGGAFGAMFGICIGVVYGPILSFSLKYG